MSVEGNSPTAVNNAIMAAADQILAGLKGGNFFPPTESAASVGNGQGAGNISQGKGEDLNTATCQSPTAVHNHTSTTAVVAAVEQAPTTVAHALRAHAEYCVSQSSQVTYDSNESAAAATPTPHKTDSDLNKIASESSLTSSEGSHPTGGGIGCQPGIQEQVTVHQGSNAPQGPPMLQVTFPTGVNAALPSTNGTRTKRSSAATACTEDDGTTGPPPAQKPRVSLTESGPPEASIATTTPVLTKQTVLVHHQHSPGQAPGQVTYQPILPAPAIPTTVARIDDAHKVPASQQVHGEMPHQLATGPRLPPPVLESRPRTISMDHKTYAPPPPGEHPTNSQTGGGVKLPPAPASVQQPMAAAPGPVIVDAKMPATQPVAPQRLVALAPRPPELDSKMPAPQPQQPPMAAATAAPAPPSTYTKALPPIYPKTYLTLLYHNHQPPNAQQGAPHAVPLPYPPVPPAASSAQSHSAVPSYPYHPVGTTNTASVHLDHMNHQHQHHTNLPPLKHPAVAGPATTATLAVTHNQTASTTAHSQHHQQHAHSQSVVVDSHHHHHQATVCQPPYHPTAAGVAATSTGVVLTKPSFPHQAPGASAPTEAAVHVPGHASPEVSPNLRNQKMQPTDCLLYAASLLQEGGSSAPPAATSLPPPETAPAVVPETHAAPYQGQVAHSQGPMAVAPATGMTSSNHPALTYAAAPHHHDAPGTVVTALQPAPGAAVAIHQPVSHSDQPQDLDVLCGRGGLINKHVGNIIYRKVVEFNKPFYQTVQKRHRILVSQSIVHTILKRGGRFLSEEANTIINPDGTQTTVTSWKPVATARAVQKTSQALRERLASSDSGSGASKTGGTKEAK